jgi:hypothetical protein
MPFLSGNKPAYQTRTQNAKTGAGGIEEFNITRELSNETTAVMEGRILPGAEDYLGKFTVTKNEVGSVTGGYKRFRTFYDGTGGFFPTNNAWLPIYPRALYVDRGNAFLEATVALPKAPSFTLKYNNATRTGRKDSTIWGDTDMTGIPIYSLGSLNPISANRKILPAYIELNERDETLELSMRHTVANTTFVVSAVRGQIDNHDTRSIDRYFGELKPYPAIPANPPTLVNPALANNANKGFDEQTFNESSWTLSGRFETVFTPKVTLFGGLVYRQSEIDIAATRLVSASIATATGTQTLIGGYNPGARPPYSYTSSGALDEDVLTGNVGVRLKPLANLDIDLAVRGENLEVSGNNTANYVNQAVVLSTGVVTQYPVTGPNSLSISEKPWTPEVQFRYTGIRKLSLYGAWDYRKTSQDERTSTVGMSVSTSAGTVTPSAVGLAYENIKERHSNAQLGANWTPSTFFNARAEVFTKDHENRFEGYATSAGSLYALNYDIYGARITVGLKPLPTVAFNTRYIVQRGKATIAEETFSNRSGDSRRYQLSESVTWNPNKSFYTQADVSVVYDTIITSYPVVTGRAKDVLHNADNNYWTGSIVAGFVVDKLTNAEIQATYYRANNYEPALAAATVPYGAGAKDYSVSAGLKRKFSDRTVGSVKLGYVESRNDTTGGNTNFRGPVAYLSLEHAL